MEQIKLTLWGDSLYLHWRSLSNFWWGGWSRLKDGY